MSRLNVLFLCTSNAARSILAEALLNRWGQDRFRAYSAGTHAKGHLHPLAVDVLKRNGLPTEHLRSKSWEEFATADAPPLHFVFTVCDRAARETCPVWPGEPIAAHWGIAGPAAVEGSDAEKARAFDRAFSELEARIKEFVSLDFDTPDRAALLRRIEAIGEPQTPASAIHAGGRDSSGPGSR